MSTVSIDTTAGGYYQSIVSQANAAQKAVNRIQMSPKLDPKGFVQPLGRITNSASEFQKSMDASAARVFAFGAAVGVINGISNSFKALISNAAEVEKSLKDIQVVMEATNSAMAKFGEGLFDVARNTASSFRTVAESATELARQGLSAEETLKRVNSALILSRLSGLGAVKSTETLTAAINSFNKEGITHEQVINRMANVDAAFAVSSADLAEAISRAGAVAQSSGVEFNELAAIVTAVQQRTARGGSVIGNGFKSIFTRIKRSGVREALEEIGVATQFVDGSFRSGIDIIKDYANVYKTLTDAQKAYTSEQIAGVFQIQNLQALIQDLNSGFSVYDKALGVANNTTNEATKRNEELNTTLDALFKQTTSSAQELAASIGQLAFSDNFKDILTFLNNLAQSINGLFSETQGSDIAKTLIQGIGKFLTGPGLVIIGAAFLKIFALVGKFAKEAISDLLGLNRETKRQQSLQAAISQILATNEKVYAKILAASGNSAKQEQIILGIIKQSTAERMKQEAIIKRIAASSRLAGIGAGEQGFIPVGSSKQRSRGKRTLGLANGFLPAINREESDIASGVGGARKGDRALATKINVGKGKRIDAVVNSGEYLVKNFQGSGADAVFNRDMAREYGLPSGAQKFNAAIGMIPGFAKGIGKVNVGGQMYNLTPGMPFSKIADDLEKQNLGVNTKQGFFTTQQIAALKRGDGVKPYDPKSGNQGINLRIGQLPDDTASKVRNFNATNSAKNLAANKRAKEEKKIQESIAIPPDGMPSSSRVTLLIPQVGTKEARKNQFITSSQTGQKYSLSYNVAKISKNLKTRGEKGIKKDVGDWMIKQSNDLSDELTGRGTFSRNNPDIKNSSQVKSQGAIGGAAGAIFETALSIIGDNKLFTADSATFDIIGKPSDNLKQVFGNSYYSPFGEAKINAGSDNTKKFHNKVIRAFGIPGEDERGKKGKKSRARKVGNKSLGFIPSFAGGFIPNFAKGETNTQKIKRLKRAQQIAKKSGNTSQVKALGIEINALSKTRADNIKKGKKASSEAKSSRRSAGVQAGARAPSAPVSEERREQKRQQSLLKSIRREFRRVQVKLARSFKSGSKSFSGAMGMAQTYGSEGLKSAGATLGNLSGKIGSAGRLGVSKVTAASSGGAKGLKDWLKERENIKERARTERKTRTEQQKLLKQQEKQARLEISRQEKFLKQQQKLTKSEERRVKTEEKIKNFKNKVSGVVVSAKSNAKIIAQATTKALKDNRVSQAANNASSQIKSGPQFIKNIAKDLSKTLASSAKDLGKKATSSIDKAISGTTKRIVDATAYMFNKVTSREPKGPSIQVDKGGREGAQKTNIVEDDIKRQEKERARLLQQQNRAQNILNKKAKEFGKFMNPYSGLDPEQDTKKILDQDRKQRAYERMQKQGKAGMFSMSPDKRLQGSMMRKALGNPGAGLAGAFILPMAAQAIEGTGPRDQIGGMRNLLSNTLMGGSYGMLINPYVGLATAGIGAVKGISEYGAMEDRRDLSLATGKNTSAYENLSNQARAMQEFSQALQKIDIAKSTGDPKKIFESQKYLKAALDGISNPKISSKLIEIAGSSDSLEGKLQKLSQGFDTLARGIQKNKLLMNLGQNMNDENFKHTGRPIFGDDMIEYTRNKDGSLSRKLTEDIGVMGNIGNYFRAAGSMIGLNNLEYLQEDIYAKNPAKAEATANNAVAVLQNLLEKRSAGNFLNNLMVGGNDPIAKEVESILGRSLKDISPDEILDLAGRNTTIGASFNKQRDQEFISALQQLKADLTGDGVTGKLFGETDAGKLLSSENKEIVKAINDALSGGTGEVTVSDLTISKKFIEAFDTAIQKTTLFMEYLSKEEKDLADNTKKVTLEMKQAAPAVQVLIQGMLEAIEIQRQAELAMIGFTNQMQVKASRNQTTRQDYDNRTGFLRNAGYIDEHRAIERDRMANTFSSIRNSNDGRLTDAMNILGAIDLSALAESAPTKPGADATGSEIAKYTVDKKSYDERQELAGFYRDFIKSNKDGNVSLGEINGAMGTLSQLANKGNGLAEQYLNKLLLAQEKGTKLLKEELKRINSNAKFQTLNDKLNRLAAAGGSLVQPSDVLAGRDIAREYKGPGSTDPVSVAAARKLAQLTGIPEERFTGFSKAEADFILAGENLKRFAKDINNGPARRVINDWLNTLKDDIDSIKRSNVDSGIGAKSAPTFQETVKNVEQQSSPSSGSSSKGSNGSTQQGQTLPGSVPGSPHSYHFNSPGGQSSEERAKPLLDLLNTLGGGPNPEASVLRGQNLGYIVELDPDSPKTKRFIELMNEHDYDLSKKWNETYYPDGSRKPGKKGTVSPLDPSGSSSSVETSALKRFSKRQKRDVMGNPYVDEDGNALFDPIIEYQKVEGKNVPYYRGTYDEGGHEGPMLRKYQDDISVPSVGSMDLGTGTSGKILRKDSLLFKDYIKELEKLLYDTPEYGIENSGPMGSSSSPLPGTRPKAPIKRLEDMDWDDIDWNYESPKPVGPPDLGPFWNPNGPGGGGGSGSGGGTVPKGPKIWQIHPTDPNGTFDPDARQLKPHDNGIPIPPQLMPQQPYDNDSPIHGPKPNTVPKAPGQPGTWADGDTGGPDGVNGGVLASMEQGIQELSNHITSLNETNSTLSDVTEQLNETNSSINQSGEEQIEALTKINDELTTVAESTTSLSEKISTFSENIESVIESSKETLNTISEAANSFSDSISSVQESVSEFVDKITSIVDSNNKVAEVVESLSTAMSTVNETITGFPTALKENLDSVVMEMRVEGKIDFNFNTQVVKDVLGPVMYEELKKLLAKPMILDYLAQQLGPRINVQRNSSTFS